MDVMIHAKLHKPDRMSNQEFFGVWKQEAEAALGAVQAGVIKNIWKVAGEVRRHPCAGCGLSRSDR